MASENDTPTAQTAAEHVAAEPTTKAPSTRAPRKRASRAAASAAGDPTATVTTNTAAPAAAAAAAAAPEVDDAPGPVKKAAKKAATRAPRKKAAPDPSSDPSQASDSAPATLEQSIAQPSAETKDTRTADAPAAAKKTARKRVSRKATSPAAPAQPVAGETTADTPTDSATEVDAEEEAAEVPTLATLGVLFQAPPARRSRRASSPAKAAPPAPAAGEVPEVAAPTDSGRTDSREITEVAPEVARTEVAGPPVSGGSTRSTRSRRSTRSSGRSASVGAEPGGAEPADAAEPAEPATSIEPPALTEPTSSTAPTDADESQDSGDDGDTDDGPRRRRRRGGKGRRGRGSDAAADLDDDTSDQDAAPSGGRRRGRSSAPSASPTSGASTTSDTSDERGEDNDSGGADSAEGSNGADGGDGESGGSRRRTRRRRRSASGGDGDDAPNVTTRVREPRRASDEVTSVKGSTRLEAKKQRRREGREAGRRRTVITESEFLARRESVERVMVVRHKEDRTQIGVLEDGVLVEHYISRETNVSMAGNIYLGRVQNVLPSMEAAFVDIGKGRNAVLYAGEVNWDAAGLDSGQSRRIEHALGSGQNVLVQVTKDPIGHKGARLTSQISLPGRYLVYVPESSMTGISRKLADTERARLKKILKEIVPESAGVIVRTAAEGASEEELRADVDRLTATWEDIRTKVEAGGGRTKSKGKASGSAPTLLHGEPDLTVRVIRDVFNEDFTSLVVAGQQAWDEVSGYVGSVAPDLAERITRWTSEEDLFTHYRIDEQIAKAMDRKVWLPSGGSLVIDRTEAMTVVDVNTGKFVGSGGNLEETVTKNNIEAAEEIVRQLRLRDIGGIIVVDFIDMVLEANRDLVVRRLLECLGRDRTKHQVAEVTSLGLVQMTRKRVGSGLIEVFSETCEHCAGRGVIVHADPVDRSNSSPHADTHAAAPVQPLPAARGGRRRGKAVESAPSPSVAAVVAPPRSGGPTPAQIAAAAHAAALKVASEIDDEGVVLVTLDEDGAHDHVVATDETTDSGLESVALVLPEPEIVSELVPELVPEIDPEADPDAAPVARPRRRRGRVTAPAGPPRGADDAVHPSGDGLASHEDQAG